MEEIPKTPENGQPSRSSPTKQRDRASSSASFADQNRWQSNMGLQTFGASLHAAAQALFPHQNRPRYSKVYVLLARWETEPELAVSKDISRLYTVFKDVYHFETEMWKISDEGSQAEADQKIEDFISLGGDSEDHLKVVCYSGNCLTTKTRGLAWTSGYKNSKHRYPTVQWSKIQCALEEAMSDVLILLDCPYAETFTTAQGNGVTELIAANAYTEENNGVRKHSFADEYEAELRALSKLPSFSIGNFYQNLLCRNQSENAEQGKQDPAPIFIPLTQPDLLAPRSIRITVHEDDHLDHLDVQSPRLPTTPGSMYSNGDSIPSFQMSSAVGHGKIPRIAFALRLKDQFRVSDLSSDLFMNWLENIPSTIEGVKIEAAFHSSSSLLIVSIPICMSIYMPPSDATINLGPITSINQVLSRFQIPRDLPTPIPDSGLWDHMPSSAGETNGMRSNGHTNGVNGNSNLTNRHKTTRFRDQDQFIPDSRLDSNLRPRYDRAYSSGRSAASSFTEEPSPATSFDGNYEPEEPVNGSCQVPTDSGGARGSSGSQSKSSAKIGNYRDEPDQKQFPRLSKPVELLRNTYDCIVIGSGYGGGVAASRMSRAGEKVCVLERGQEKWPGEYPSGFIDAMKEFHVSGEFAPDVLKGNMVEGGDPTGLYHLIVGKGQNAFVGNGLGGTSLLNANVFLEADKGTMGLDDWPKELRREGELDKYYQRAKDVLQPVSYPHDWPKLPKLSMLEKQAKFLEDNGTKNKFYRVPQTTRFVGGPNSTGVEMYPSALTGMDCTGVNDGSKSSTLVNYLSDAWNWGAEMFCECEVRYIKKSPDGGYLVFFAWHGSNRGAFRERLYEDLMWVHARKCVFLGAGSIGTTEILLRSKKLGLSMSDKVGTGMSGNGDMLAFGYNTHEEVNSIGRQYPSPYNPIGPTISGIIDCRDQENPLDGFVIQEGAIPKALSIMFQTMLEMMPGNQAPQGEGVLDKVKHVAAQFGSRFLGPYFRKGSIEKTQVYLVMSHDSNQAILTLKNDQPVLEFQGVANSSGVNKIHELLKKATIAVGGTYVKNPFESYLSQEITVHPIGGACMSKDGTAAHGVTNHFGEVLTGHGTETHQGLVVTDGAVIPTALGVNPFATITALAERSVEHAARDIKKHIDFDTPNETLDLFGSPGQYIKASDSPARQDTMQIAAAKKLVEDTVARKANGFGFSEVMSGYVHVGDGVEGDKPEDFETAARTARGLCEESRFFLSVQTFDTDTTVNRADHKAMLTGTFTCAGLRGSPFLVQRGDFHLFRVDVKSPGTRNLVYEFDMISTEGQKYHFHGFKVVDSSVALGPIRFWQATTTLYVTISEAAESGGKVLGRGMLHIKPMDFLSEILTLKPSGRNFLAKLTSTASFMGYFARQSASLFLAPLVYQQYPAVTYNGYINDTSPDATIKIISLDNDGIETKMQIWEPRNPTIMTKNLFMIPGASVDHQIFALPTIEVNAVNYFTRAGYRVFVTVHRICQLKVAENHWTTFDARHDIRACLQWIRDNVSDEKIYTVAHCMGSVAYSCGLLDGTIPADWISGISCSQVFMNPVWSPLNMLKVKFSPDKLYSAFGGSWFSCQSTRDDSYFQQLVNQILRFYPDSRNEMCNNVSCHRCSLIFGRLWNHRNLNEATHRQINRFFGGVNMTLLATLKQMGWRGLVTTNGPDYEDLTTEKNIANLEGIPIMLFSGSDNQVLKPYSTDKTYTILRNKFGVAGYTRHVIQGYGHLDCWMGREAYKDVFPKVREQVDKVCRPEGYAYREPDWKNDWDDWKKLPKSSDWRTNSPENS